MLYFPPSDVRIELLRRSEKHTTCPFKGEASYYGQLTDGEDRELAWFYPRVYDEVAPIAGYIAFYREFVELNELPPE